MLATYDTRDIVASVVGRWCRSAVMVFGIIRPESYRMISSRKPVR